jgi:Domain of unknown function (DUF222)
MFDSDGAPAVEQLAESDLFPDRPGGWTIDDELAMLTELEHPEAIDVVDDEPPGQAPPQWRSSNTDPSSWLAWELDADSADPAALSDAELIDAMTGWEKLAAWALARQARVIAEFARRRPGDDPTLVTGRDLIPTPGGYAADEVGMALRLTRKNATRRLARSAQLVAWLPETLTLWEAGRLDERKVNMICEATDHLGRDLARAVQHRVLTRAPQHTSSQLKAALNRAIQAADPEGAAHRHTAARSGRRVTVNDEDDGMASLWALLTAPDARSAYEWLTRLARGIGADDPRGMDARRADLLVALLTGQLTCAGSDDPDSTEGTGSDSADSGVAEPRGTADADTGTAGEATTVPPRPITPGKPLVHVVMPFTTLIGADDQPCELVGHGPIPADLAREIAADAELKRLIYDPLSGALLDHGRTTYRPPAALADYVRARDVHCRSPICRRRALDAELDHVVPYPEGPTSADNLVDSCVHDHHLKHSPGWHVTFHQDGRLEWITPTGHRYFSHPYDYRPDDPPLPPPRHPTTGPPSTPPDRNAGREWDGFSRYFEQAEPADPDDPPPF